MAIIYQASQVRREAQVRESPVADEGGVTPKLRQGTTVVHSEAISRTQAGVWECHACDWTQMTMGERAEFFYVVEGTMVIQEEGHDPTEVSAGMSVYSPPGWVGRFHVPERLLKSFVSFYPATDSLSEVPG